MSIRAWARLARRAASFMIDMQSDGTNRYLPTHPSDWFHADGSSLNSARVEWVGADPVSIDLGSANIGRYPGQSLPGQQVGFDLAGSTAGQAIDGYSGTFAAFDGSTHNVGSLSEFGAYNDWLVSELQADMPCPPAISAYNTELAKGYKLSTQTTVTPDNLWPAAGQRRRSADAQGQGDVDACRRQEWIGLCGTGRNHVRPGCHRRRAGRHQWRHGHQRRPRFHGGRLRRDHRHQSHEPRHRRARHQQRRDQCRLQRQYR